MLLGMMFAGLFVQVLCVMREPECTCSKFHYEEQTLEKMIRTEMKFQDLQEKLDAKLDGFTIKLEDMSQSTNKQLQTFRNTNERFLTTSGETFNTTLNKIKTLAEDVEGMFLSLFEHVFIDIITISS